MPMPDDDAGRKNVEALATRNISPFWTEILAPSATCPVPLLLGGYLNRRLSVRAAYPAAFLLRSFSNKVLIVPSARAALFALKRCGFEIETASSKTCKTRRRIIVQAYARNNSKIH